MPHDPNLPPSHPPAVCRNGDGGSSLSTCAFVNLNALKKQRRSRCVSNIYNPHWPCFNSCSYACMHAFMDTVCVSLFVVCVCVCVRHPPLSISSRLCSCPTDERLSSRQISWMQSGLPSGFSPSPWQLLMELWWARGYNLFLWPGYILWSSYFRIVLISFQPFFLACPTVLQMCTVEFGFPGLKAQAVAMRPLSTVAGIPFMYSWSPLQHNFMVGHHFFFLSHVIKAALSCGKIHQTTFVLFCSFNISACFSIQT